jgi:hypothetical protein
VLEHEEPYGGGNGDDGAGDDQYACTLGRRFTCGEGCVAGEGVEHCGGIPAQLDNGHRAE